MRVNIWKQNLYWWFFLKRKVHLLKPIELFSPFCYNNRLVSVFVTKLHVYRFEHSEWSSLFIEIKQFLDLKCFLTSTENDRLQKSSKQWSSNNDFLLSDARKEIVIFKNPTRTTGEVIEELSVVRASWFQSLKYSGKYILLFSHTFIPRDSRNGQLF